VTIAERIKTWREWAGLTPVQLAKKCSVSAEAVYQWEAGVNEPRHSNVDKIVEAVGISLPVFWSEPPARKRCS
jgi:transcriptional regulator with XRE-family HTH domain